MQKKVFRMLLATSSWSILHRKRKCFDLPNLQGIVCNWGSWGTLSSGGRTCPRVWSLFWWSGRCSSTRIAARRWNCPGAPPCRWSSWSSTSCSRSSCSRLLSSSWFVCRCFLVCSPLFLFSVHILIYLQKLIALLADLIY